MIVWRYVLPNAATVLVIQGALSTGQAILTEAGLSFLGLGIQPPIPSWGSMIEVGRGYLGQAPWMSIVPGTAVFLAVLAFNFTADALLVALDPRLRTRTARRPRRRSPASPRSAEEPARAWCERALLTLRLRRAPRRAPARTPARRAAARKWRGRNPARVRR